MSHLPDWQDLDGLKVRATIHPPDASDQLPTGRQELEAIAVLRKHYGGKRWRRVSTSRRPVEHGWEVSSTWKNEYDVEVEVME